MRDMLKVRFQAMEAHFSFTMKNGSIATDIIGTASLFKIR